MLVMEKVLVVGLEDLGCVVEFGGGPGRGFWWRSKWTSLNF